MHLQQFWATFCESTKLENIHYQGAFQFGASADHLAQLVVEGKKTATTSGYEFYALENEPLPQAGEYYIVLNSANEPTSVIQIQQVEVLPMNEVSEAFALAEGEGDYPFWWDAHEAFFKVQLQHYNRAFTPSMLVVCERFTTVYSRHMTRRFCI